MHHVLQNDCVQHSINNCIKLDHTDTFYSEGSTVFRGTSRLTHNCGVFSEFMVICPTMMCGARVEVCDHSICRNSCIIDGVNRWFYSGIYGDLSCDTFTP